jgi:ABC-type nitrate/sulfonate/bicarbonate transport system substrate-binding protein
MAFSFRVRAGARFAVDSRGEAIFRATNALHKPGRSQTNLREFPSLRSRSLLRRHIFAAIATAMLGVAGVGSSAHAQMKQINFFVVNNLFGSPGFVAVENGYFAQQGLDVKIKLTASGSQVTQALQAGEAQIGHASLSTTTAAARAAGNLLKGVMPYYNDAQYISLGGRAIIGRKDRGIDAKNPKSMEGKKVGYLSGGNEAYMVAWFKKNHVDISKVTLINIPVPDMPISISQGLVDAIVPWEPYTSQAIRQLGDNAVVLSRAEGGLAPDIIGIVANQDWMKQNYDLLEKFSVALAQAAQFIRKNPGKAAEIDTSYIDGLNIEDATEGIKSLHWDPRISVCTIAGMVSAGNDMIKAKLIKMSRPFTPDDFVDKTVIDRVMQKHPELFSDLPPLPKTLDQCKDKMGT